MEEVEAMEVVQVGEVEEAGDLICLRDGVDGVKVVEIVRVAKATHAMANRRNNVQNQLSMRPNIESNDVVVVETMGVVEVPNNRLCHEGSK